MSGYDYSKRVRIITYRFIERLKFEEISSKIEGTTPDGCRKLCKRAQQRAKSNKITDLLKSCIVAHREGAPRRVEPGSRESIAIRAAVRGPYCYQDETEAANRVYRKLRSKNNRKPLKELAPQQVRNILRGAAHSMTDPRDTKPITRKRTLPKKKLNNNDLTAREQYCNQVLEMRQADYVLIAVDETPIDFGGSGGRQHVSAPVGVTDYSSKKDPRFSIMQWAAASSETRPQRPHCIWTPESNEISDQLMQKFNAAKEILQKEVDRQREQSQIEGPPNSYISQS